MNKLFTKLAKIFLGLSMAAGVGVAVGSKEAKSVKAVNYAWQKITSTSEFVDGTEILVTQGSYYLNVSATSTSQTPRLASLTLSGGLPTLTANNTECFLVSGSGSSIKLCKATDTTKWLITGSSNNAARINTGTTGHYWTISSAGTNEFYLQSNSGSRYLSRYQTTDFRSYTNSNTNANLVLYKLVESQQTQTITVDPASKEAYTDETISLTTNATSAGWALSNNTCGASLSAASGKTVTVSATSAGSVRVTASASGYTSPYVDLTFNEKPTSPVITPEKSSTSGYTGQNETISFTYANLSSSLGVSSSNTSVVTVGTPSYSAGEGSVQFNFVGAGSTTVKFKDGSTELASVSVSVAASSVTITGLPASKDVYIGKTVDLGSLISVTATGIYSNAVTWESDDDGIATVTAAGVVSGVSEGDVDITVTSDDYPSATMICTVSVSEAPLEYEIVFGTAEATSGITDFSNSSYVIPSGVTLNNIQGNVYSNTSNQAASLRFGKSGTTGSFDATISGNYYITSVKCNLKYYGTDTTATFAVTPSGGSAISKSLTSSWADYTYDVSTAKAKTVTLGTNVNGKRAYLSGFTITYASAKSLSSISLSGTYPTTFTEGDTFDHTGMVVTANYSDSTSANVTSSATWSSPDMSTAGNKTVTVSYTDAYGSVSTTYSITVNADTTPHVNPAKSSTSGYTGQNEILHFSYGHLTYDPTVESQNTSVVTVGTPSLDSGSGSVQLNFVGVGSTTIKFFDGQTERANVSVSVAKTAFTTSPSDASVQEGQTTTLSAALNSGGSITWSSSDDDIATVDNGVVTGVEEGVATITARSVDDTSVTATCTITVTGVPESINIGLSDIENFTNSYQFYNWSKGTLSGQLKGYKTTTNPSQIQFGSVNSGVVRGIMFNEVAVPGPITGISFLNGSGTQTFKGYFSTDNPITSCPSSGEITTSNASWTLDPSDGYHYFYFERTGSTGAFTCDEIIISYQKVKLVDPTGITLNDSTAISMDTYGFGRRTLKANVLPANNNDPTVNWGTSDSSVVTVENGILTAVGVGNATVYATTGNFVSDVATPELKTSVSVTVTQALYKKATFIATSTNAATESDDYIDSGSVDVVSDGSYDNTHHGIQLTSGKDATFTISGYAGMKILGVDMVLSSNGSGGGASLSVSVGSTNILSIAAAPFSDETWNGAYDASPVDIYRATTERVVGENESITFSFHGSENSLYVSSVAVRYIDYSLEQWCINFMSQITCDGSGSITSDSNWTTLSSSFSSLNIDLKNIAANATANKDSDNVIEQCVARYDLIIRKYGTDTAHGGHTDFIGRFGVGKVNGPLNQSRMVMNNLLGENANTVAIIVIISMVSVTAIGGYFFLRKRKENI